MATSPLEDTFESVQWEEVPPTLSDRSSSNPLDTNANDEASSSPELNPSSSSPTQDKGKGRETNRGGAMEGEERGGEEGSHWDGWLEARIVDYKKEKVDGKDSFVTFGVAMRTNLPTFPKPDSRVRRRFQDFVFLHNNLVKDFPACVVPPLPDKHRLEYLPGRDRFGAEFLEKRVEDLQRFLTRLTRHQTLRRASLFTSFLSAPDWSIIMHRHLAHPPGPDPPASIIDSISDSIVNLTSGKVRKPDQRFEEMRESMDRFDYGLSGVEKGAARVKGRVGDLSDDYSDFASSVKALGYLESGITDPLNKFADRMIEFSTVLHHTSTTPLPPFISHLHSLLLYSQTHRNLLALRDQKQLDSEVLSEYLGSVVIERDRLASLVETGGHPGNGAGVGLGTYFKDRVEKLRGKDDVGHRRERMRKLDGKIKELQEAVTSAVETSNAFSEETLREHENFELNKKEEMKELLGEFADAQIKLYRDAMADWDKVIPVLARIRVDN